MPIRAELPIQGTLFVSGAGRIDELRPRFLESVGGPDARILTIPSGRDLRQSDDVMNGWPTVPA